MMSIDGKGMIQGAISKVARAQHWPAANLETIITAEAGQGLRA